MLSFQNGPFIARKEEVATDFAVKVFASNHTMTGRFFLSLYVGSITLYLWVSEEWKEPCILYDIWLSNGFIQEPMSVTCLNASTRFVTDNHASYYGFDYYEHRAARDRLRKKSR